MRLAHGGAKSAHHQHNAGSSRHQPLAIDLLHVLNVNFLGNALLKKNRGVLGDRFKSGHIIKWKWRHHNAHANLKTTFHFELGQRARGQVVEKFTNGRGHSLLLNHDGGVAKARGELQRINALAIHDAIEIDVAHIFFTRQHGLHLQERGCEQVIGVAPKHGGAHFASGRSDIAGK